MKAETWGQKRFRWRCGLLVAAAMVTLTLYTGCTQNGDRTSPTESGILSVPLQHRRLGRVPPFALIERNGKDITLADLRGKVWIADFIFTQCVDACPLMSATMARLQSEFVNEPDLRLVSISVDPEYDTPAILARYATQFGADPDRWYFLTGEKKTIYRLVREGFKLAVQDPDDPQAFHAPAGQTVLQMLSRWVDPEPARAHEGHSHRQQPVIHSDRLVLVDRVAWIRGYYHGTDTKAIALLREDVRELLRAGKTP